MYGLATTSKFQIIILMPWCWSGNIAFCRALPLKVYMPVPHKTVITQIGHSATATVVIAIGIAIYASNTYVRSSVPSGPARCDPVWLSSMLSATVGVRAHSSGICMNMRYYRSHRHNIRSVNLYIIHYYDSISNTI